MTPIEMLELEMRDRLRAKDAEIERLTSQLEVRASIIAKLSDQQNELVAALEFYADPETYFAIMCLGDPPCGEFIKDYSDDHGHPDLVGPRYGKRARAALAAATATDHNLTKDNPE